MQSAPLLAVQPGSEKQLFKRELPTKSAKLPSKGSESWFYWCAEAWHWVLLQIPFLPLKS